ncbi:MAG: hypothetical protein M3Y82_07020 [Verrucomicrobiota bacterium]|nr:hypothetical protein [Verrucomicrobiota bacterium]
MKVLIVIGIIAIAAFGGWTIYSKWEKINAPEKEKAAIPIPAAPEISGSQLPGMLPSLEGSLAAAQKRGAPGLQDFLARYGKTIRDPRLGSIELDYVVLVAPHKPDQAKKVFTRVKQRTPSSSPIYSRIKLLENTYE